MEQFDQKEKLDLILNKLESLEKRNKFYEETWDEFSPIFKLVMNSGSETLQALNEKGYFKFLEGMGLIATEVMENYSPEDLENLRKSIVGILDTVRMLTQDDVLAIAGEAAEAISEADQNKPIGVRGMLKASRDQDVRRGMAMMVELLRHIGKGTKKIKGGSSLQSRLKIKVQDPRQQKLASMLAPKRKMQKAEVCITVPGKNPATAAQTTCLQIDGIEFDGEGFLINHGQWNEDLARQIAASMGITDLTDAHWQLIKYSRNECLAQKGTPNMRALCTGCNINAKEVFNLFPKAPAKTIAKIAGVSKPVGCI